MKKLLLMIFVPALILLGWVGLRLKPDSFPPFPQPPLALKKVPLPEGLPAPVARFYRRLYGEEIPIITSAVISGRATLRLPSKGGITFPARFRITHLAGQGYRHYIEATFLGLPVLKVNEHYLEGQARMALPFGVIEGESRVDQAANLALWAESLTWLPSLLITDRRVRWEPVDEHTALLIVPFGEAEEHFVARFDPDTGLLRLLESMRYREAADKAKILWLNEVLEWDTLNGSLTPTVAAVTWLDEGKPWAIFTVEELVYNANVETYIRAEGP